MCRSGVYISIAQLIALEFTLYIPYHPGRPFSTWQHFQILAADLCNKIPSFETPRRPIKAALIVSCGIPRISKGVTANTCSRKEVVQTPTFYKGRGNCSVRVTSKTGSFADGSILDSFYKNLSDSAWVMRTGLDARLTHLLLSQFRLSGLIFNDTHRQALQQAVYHLPKKILFLFARHPL